MTTSTSTLTWRTETMRVVAVCGDLDVGAIFPSVGRRTRWRSWITVNMTPVDGNAPNDELAKVEVEKRWAAVLEKARLQPIALTTPEEIVAELGPKEQADGEA